MSLASCVTNGDTADLAFRFNKAIRCPQTSSESDLSDPQPGDFFYNTTTDNFTFIQGNGPVTIGGSAGCQFYMTNTATLNNGAYSNIGETEVAGVTYLYNYGSLVTDNFGAISVTAPGLYAVSANLTFFVDDAFQTNPLLIVVAFISVNGINTLAYGSDGYYWDTLSTDTYPTGFTLQPSQTLLLAGGDVIRCTAFQLNGSGLQMNVIGGISEVVPSVIGYATTVTVNWVGPTPVDSALVKANVQGQLPAGPLPMPARNQRPLKSGNTYTPRQMPRIMSPSVFPRLPAMSTPATDQDADDRKKKPHSLRGC